MDLSLPIIGRVFGIIARPFLFVAKDHAQVFNAAMFAARDINHGTNIGVDLLYFARMLGEKENGRVTRFTPNCYVAIIGRPNDLFINNVPSSRQVNDVVWWTLLNGCPQGCDIRTPIIGNTTQLG
eukprot:scaffold5220_cov188-Amphora_coffeaeformis.AAC.1